jgi:hypothetical protein
VHGRARAWTAAATAAVALGTPLAAAHAATPLDDAPVPSLCEHPAGTLVGGQLPGIPEGQGGVWLAARDRPGMIKRGRIRGAGDRAAVLSCFRGGVSWPENIVVYDADKRILGTVRLLEVTKGGRESVARLRIHRRTVIADINAIAQRDDAACCGSATARLELRWDRERDRIRVTSRRKYTERKPMKRLIRAVNRGRRRAARKLASAAVVDRFFEERGDGARFRFHNCEGSLSAEWWIEYLSDGWLRACTVNVSYAPLDGEQSWALLVNRRGLHGYRATGVQGIAG